MQIDALLATIMLSGISAYDKQGPPWKPVKKPYDTIQLKRIAAFTVRPAPIEWCLYWEALGVQRPQCIRTRQRRAASPRPAFFGKLLGIKSARLGSRSTPTCRSRFLLSTCAPSEHCSAGRLCMDTTRALCCIPPVQECPTPLQLGFDCVVKVPVNWCTYNEDCGKRKCCPTGCDYNVCV